MPKKILLDMDGVLCNFRDGFKQFSNKCNRKEYNEGIESIINTDFYSKLEKYDSVDIIINYVVDNFGEYYICSTPLHEDWDNSISHKKLWIKNNLSIKPKEIYFTDKKYKLADQNTILIDDYSKNVKEFIDAGGIGIDFKNTNSEFDFIRMLDELGKYK